MKIEFRKVSIREVAEGYANNAEEGVLGYKGNLNIRPKYQREYVYKDKERNAVINSVRQDYPLNVIYWSKNIDGTYEVLDGQQRIISICEYISGKFSIGYQYFHNLEEGERNQILNYELMVYFCEGSDKEKLNWFRIINIAGTELTEQELKNATYTGTWLSDAKRHFSKTECVAYNLAKDYVRGSPIRQDYLETAISWISNDEVAQYMADNQHKPNANTLWQYFQNVINWVKIVFPMYRVEMKGIQFGTLYNQFKDKEINTDDLETEITELMQDEDVTKKSGIYAYVLTRDDRYLNIRIFTDNQKREAYERQTGICTKCGGHFETEDMEADHIIPWHEGGKTIAENCQMLCKQCNRTKSGK